MKNTVYIRIAALVAAVIGLMAVVVGFKVLTGRFIPDYNVLPWLVKYNTAMGVLSIVTAIVLWLNNRFGLKLTALVALSHVAVLGALLTAYHDVVAAHSVKAMIFRAATWVVLFIVVWKKTARNPAKT